MLVGRDHARQSMNLDSVYSRFSAHRCKDATVAARMGEHEISRDDFFDWDRTAGGADRRPGREAGT